ncbi:MAG: D-alanine--D-alanine ligase [Gammaproteobacteria bacterium]|nr:D-alanine--D-alanine ligase [Gammaproteobacteria bacterium]MYB36993.1 D-alanine--D-alanine ligase [Gammaproteobacteria bacterium]
MTATAGRSGASSSPDANAGDRAARGGGSTRVAVLAGGSSAEAEVSRSSATQVAAALKGRSFDVQMIELDAGCVDVLRAFAPDVVFPVLHGPPGEDGTVQGMLSMLGFPYVGSDVRGAAASMDKHIAKAVFRDAGLPLANDLTLPAGTDAQVGAELVRQRLPGPVAIKPRSLGSGLGVTLLPDGGDVADALHTALSYGDGVVVEEFITGREITVGVLDLHDEPASALPVVEIIVGEGEWYDYTNRYTPGRSEHVIPAPVSDDVAAGLKGVAMAAHRALCLRDLSRADFILGDNDDFVLLEVNAIPGMTPTSLYPDACRAVGIDFATLTTRLVQSASRRGPS